MIEEKHKGHKKPKEAEEKLHEAETVDYKDKWLRALAEYENLKKRVEREKQETIKFSNQFLIIELFPIMDSFDSAIKTVESTNNKDSFLKGLKMLQGELHRILEVNGLKKLRQSEKNLTQTYIKPKKRLRQINFHRELSQKKYEAAIR